MASVRRFDLGHQSARICDRFSNLPDNIAHKILEFLEVGDFGRLSLVSKRCEQRCLSVPTLSIDYKTLTYYILDYRQNFVSFLDRFMASRHKNGIVTHNFCIRWSFEGNIYDAEEESHVVSWLHQVLTPKLQTLDLYITPRVSKPFDFPPIVFQCISLLRLVFDAPNSILKFPTSSPGFPNLEVLVLKYVRIEHPLFGQWVSSFCLSLKILLLVQVSGLVNINITSSSLQNFSLYALTPNDIQNINISAENLLDLNLQSVPNSSTCTSLTVYAPYLSKFILTGHPVNYYYCVGKLMWLQSTVIDLSESAASTGHNLDDLIQSVGSSKILELSFYTLKVLYGRGFLPSSSLSDIEKLMIDTYSLEDDQVPAVAALLSRMPNLKAFHLTRFRDSSHHFKSRTHYDFPVIHSFFSVWSKFLPSKNFGFSMGYWESQSLMFIHHLKSAVVELPNGRWGNELELVKYLLKHAKELEKMKIIYWTTLSSNVRCEVEKYRKASTEVVYSNTRMYCS